MSDKELWAVYLDYAFEDGKLDTVVLGGSINNAFWSRKFLDEMAAGMLGYDDERGYCEVDEDDLPSDYKFQTYYVARYFPKEEGE